MLNFEHFWKCTPVYTWSVPPATPPFQISKYATVQKLTEFISHDNEIISSRKLFQKISLYIRICYDYSDFWQESSAKLTNQGVSYAFNSSPFNFHACHILPASKFKYSYSCILLIFYTHQWTACMRTVSVNTVHWFDASSSGNPNE